MGAYQSAEASPPAVNPLAGEGEPLATEGELQAEKREPLAKEGDPPAEELGTRIGGESRIHISEWLHLEQKNIAALKVKGYSRVCQLVGQYMKCDRGRTAEFTEWLQNCGELDEVQASRVSAACSDWIEERSGQPCTRLVRSS